MLRLWTKWGEDPSPESGLLAASASLLFPPQCPVTGERVLQPGRFSPVGWAQLQLLGPPGCDLCAQPFAQEAKEEPLCAACAAPDRYERNLCGRGRLDRVRSALVYDETSAELVLSLKYGDRHDLARALGGLLERPFHALGAPKTAHLVPVPLHPSRLRARRFNQAALLARALSDKLADKTGAVIDLDTLRRVKATAQQKGLGFSRRTRNLAGAFQAMPDARGRAFILIDDVLTSGATLIGCARALRKAGATYVGALTVARVCAEGKEPQVLLPENEE